jgi:hypothetical protein
MSRREAGTYAFAGAAAMAVYCSAPTAALAEDAALGPVLAVVTHPVAEVFTDATNPLTIVILHRFATKDAAKAFFANRDLAAAMQRDGVTAPPTIIFSNVA